MTKSALRMLLKQLEVRNVNSFIKNVTVPEHMYDNGYSSWPVEETMLPWSIVKPAIKHTRRAA